MPERHTNLALLALTLLAVVSGLTAFAMGTGPGRWMVVSHGLLGIAVLVLAPWKTAIARRGFARHGASRWISLGLGLAALVTIVSGFVLVTGLADTLGPFTSMQLHVGAGTLALVLTIVHYRQRPVKPRAADLSRRNTLRAAGLIGVSGVLYLTVEWLLDAFGLPGDERRFTGSHDIGPGARVPPTQWLNDRVQHLDPSTHVVRFPGIEYTMAQIDELGDVVEATLDCTSGWYATRQWSGARLDQLLDGATGVSVVIRSVTGYWRRFPITHANRLWLATRLEDQPLEPENGAPVRLVAPGRRGFWWVKWVASVEVDDLPPWWQPTLPLA